MKIRNKDTKEEGTSGSFNTSSLSEIFVYFDDWMDTDYMSNYEYFIEAKGVWMDSKEAMGPENHIITDNYNVYFFEPTTEEDRKRGYTL